MRFFGVSDWRSLPILKAADWCGAMVVQPESWTHRALNPDWRWGELDSQLLGEIVDELRIANWQRSSDGAKGKNRPKRLPRPGVPGYRRPGETTKSIEQTDFAEIERLLALPRVDASKR